MTSLLRRIAIFALSTFFSSSIAAMVAFVAPAMVALAAPP